MRTIERSLFFVALLAPSAYGQLSNQAKAQINQQAALFASEPAKLAIKPIAQGTVVGKASEVQISLLNADNQPVPAKSDSQYEISLQSPAGSPDPQKVEKVWIKKGETSTHFEFTPDQAGLTTLTVRPISKDVRPDKVDILAVPSKPQVQVKAKVAGRPISRSHR